MLAKRETDNLPHPKNHNNPPSPFEEVEKEITDLYEEAKQWLDGEPITTQGMADDIGKLINMLREAGKKAEALRKEEVAPFDDGKAKVQARYAPLIADTKSTKGKVVLALDTCKKALVPWLEKLEAEKREAEAKAKAEAEEKRRAAEEAIRESRADDLDAREAAEAKLTEAKQAEAVASRASKERARTAGGGRAVSLRSEWVPELVSGVEAARHYWQANRAELEEWLLDMAKKDVRNGVQSIPGFTITEKKKAV